MAKKKKTVFDVKPLENDLIGVELDAKELKKLIVKENGKVVKPIALAKTALVSAHEFAHIPSELKEDYEYDEYTRTYKTKNEVWAKQWRNHSPFWRHPEDPRYVRTSVTGSEIAVGFDGSELEKRCLINLYEGQHGSNFKCLNELVAEKQKRKLMKEESNDSVFFTGHLEEDSIRLRFVERWKKAHPQDTIEVENDTWMYTAGYRNADGTLKYPFVLCDLDGTVTINGIKGVLECKTVQFSSPDYVLWKNGIVPLKYYLQCVYYMMCINAPFAIICCKWGISENDFTYIFISRNFEVEEGVMDIAKTIVKAVESGEEPNFREQNPELLLKYYRKRFGGFDAGATPVMLDRVYGLDAVELIELADEENNLKQRLKEITNRRRTVLANILPETRGANKVFIPLGDEYLEVTVKKKATRYMIDEDKVMEKYPDLYERYQKQSFDATTFSKENKNILSEVLKDEVLTEAKLDTCDLRMDVKEDEVRKAVNGGK